MSAAETTDLAGDARSIPGLVDALYGDVFTRRSSTRTTAETQGGRAGALNGVVDRRADAPAASSWTTSGDRRALDAASAGQDERHEHDAKARVPGRLCGPIGYDCDAASRLHDAQAGARSRRRVVHIDPRSRPGAAAAIGAVVLARAGRADEAAPSSGSNGHDTRDSLRVGRFTVVAGTRDWDGAILRLLRRERLAMTRRAPAERPQGGVSPPLRGRRRIVISAARDRTCSSAQGVLALL